ncbi:OsmC family protein [Angustibacter aerolatus]|uniref:Osmotically inducible protein C n=1 Tax=Angustibacter aerolatus TaxID=1162965 RepID=A0ABQ6JM71_9ACTN|nr:OsmC family protein [Angustibacter aerolatus]GMA88219.1 hypothetical protein GCM10025868_34690 [Angustibacter aerolatus]
MPYDVRAASGSLREPGLPVLPHRWTDGGVSVRTDFTGAHLLHLSVAGCVLNDVHREAPGLGVVVDGVRVTASGDLDPTTWASTGITYLVDVDGPSGPEQVAALLTRVDAVAEIPRALRVGTVVQRAGAAD